MSSSKEGASSSTRGRGRPIPEDGKERLKNALEDLLAHKSAGHKISIREVAEYYKVSNSTLSRYYAEAKKKNKKQSSNTQSSNKHSISFLLSKEK